MNLAKLMLYNGTIIRCLSHFAYHARMTPNLSRNDHFTTHC